VGPTSKGKEGRVGREQEGEGTYFYRGTEGRKRRREETDRNGK